MLSSKTYFPRLADCDVDRGGSKKSEWTLTDSFLSVFDLVFRTLGFFSSLLGASLRFFASWPAAGSMLP